MSTRTKVLSYLALWSLAALVLTSAVSAARQTDPRKCAFLATAGAKGCATDAAVNVVKVKLHTDGAIGCTAKAANFLRYRCALKNAWQTGTVIVAWAPTSFAPTVTVLGMVCEATDATGAALPQTGCTKTVPFKP